MTNKEIYEYHGWREQCKHITSEMYELTEAIHDYELGFGTKEHIAEELADVLFMLEQIKDNYDIPEHTIKEWQDFKGTRESKRIKEGYYGSK